MKKGFTLLYFMVLFFLAAGAGSKAVSVPRPDQLRFTENRGQWNERIRFKTEIPNGQLLLENNAFYFFLYSAKDLSKIQHPGKGEKTVINGHAFKEEFVGANLHPVVTGHNVFADYANYFLGNDPAHWAGGVKIFPEIEYKNIYTGIDLKLYTRQGMQLKYDWIVKPGADAGKIKIHYNGVDELNLRRGALTVKTSVGDMVEEKPFAYQSINGFKREVKCNFVIVDEEVSFEFPDGYDKNIELIIDPTVVFSTYTGARADNWGYTATYDSRECMYLGGYVNATPQSGITLLSYPTTVGAFQTTWGGGTGGGQGNGNGIAFACDMGITKFTADGTQLVYSTYIGGSDNETPHSLVVDPQGSLVIYGVTYSSNYPVTGNAYDNTYNGDGDIVVTRLNATGSALVGSTFVGGSAMDGINYDPEEFTSGELKRNYGDQNRGEVNVDAANNIYIASCTQSSDFPTTGGAIQTAFGGGQDGCAFKLNSDCSALQWCTYLGGNAHDACYSLDLGPAGTLYVAGGTMSGNFPTTAGTIHSNYQGGLYDGFLSQINPTGTQLLASSFIGTAGDDQVYFVKLDARNDVYFVGQTTGVYPVANAPYSNPNSGQFISKVKPDLTGVIYSTVFGNGNGRPNISPTAFLVDTCENVYVAGWGCSPNSIFSQSGFAANVMTSLPLTSDALQSSTDGTDFYFFVLAKNAQNILYGSYFGGNGNEEHVDGGTSRFDKRGVMYQAMCAGCGGNSITPTTSGVWSPTNRSYNCNELGLKIAFNLSGTEVQIAASPRATGCVPLTVQFRATSNAASVQWDFGDGGTSTQNNPLHTYTDTGTYYVMLVGVDPNSCNLSDTAYIDVVVRDDSIVANFLPNLNIDCYSNSVSISSSASQTAKYFWNMGDGALYNTDSISHSYASAGIYDVSLIVSDSTRCSLADTFTTKVTIPAFIDASYAASSSRGCIPLTVDFWMATPSTQATYYWSFGDGVSSIFQTPGATHTYTVADTFQVRLIVIDSASCNIADTAYNTIITIDSVVKADFNFVRTFFGCDSVQVTAWSSYQGEDSEIWDFGDGTPQQANNDTVYHVYNTAGTFTITHYIADAVMICKPLDTARIAFSLVPLNAGITIPDTGGCLPFNATLIGTSVLYTTDFTWYFGDGTTATGDTVQHLYTQTGTFNVVALAIDTNACVAGDSAFAQVTVIDDSVHADFDLIVLNDCDSNLVVDLQNTSTNAVEFLWTFGDGTSSVLQNENHSYTVPATYTITLYVTDTNRCHPYDTIAKNVTLKPNLFIDFTAANVCAGTPVTFINLSNPSAAYVWTFGDGLSSDQYSPQHLYTTTGTKNVMLTITDTSTCDVMDSVKHDIEVYPQPIANFTTAGDTFKFELPVQFTNRSFAYESLYWSFGDGDSSSEENPIHIYESIYNMNVCLRAYNEVCADTTCKNIYISFSGLIGVPNAFSPNGDGVNDVVKVEGRGIVELEFRIYNRWGEKVFETRDKNIGWDGIYKGVLQEMEVYTYAVEATLINGQHVPLKGNITLLR